MDYALVKDGVIVNVIVWDGEAKYEPPEGHEMIALSDLPEGAGIGWQRQGKKWRSPK